MSKQKTIALQATDAFAITPHDTNTISTQTSGKYDFCTLWIGTAGDGTLSVVTLEGTTVSFAGVPVGHFPLAVKQVRATGTGASNIRGFVSKHTLGE